MPWLKAGDNAATHPIVMRVAGVVRSITAKVPERDVAINEVFGFVMRCALQSAGHTTDYVVDEGTAFMIGGARTDRLLELATQAGYVKRARQSGHQVYVLVQDPEFIHIRRKAEIEWERQQKADAANPQLIVPVRIRDGDACRYCAQVVNWRDRRGGRGGTYDHRQPGTPAGPDSLVVACRSCNSGRRDRDDAEERYPLRPAPAVPFYSELTAEFLREHGHTVTPTDPADDDVRPGNQPDNATPRPPTQGDNAPAATRHRGGPRAPTAARSADPADRLGTESNLAGTGRVGTGSAGRSVDPARRKRSRRRRPPAQRNGEA